MSIKKIISSNLLLSFFFILATVVQAQEIDPLHKRKFNLLLDEVKDGVPGKKGIADKLLFKNGKLFSDYLYDKYEYKWIRYRINKDSIYQDSTETEVRYLELEASLTDEANQSVIINFVILEWDLDGTIKITKNDKIKRYFDVVGREKGGKPKKEKKKSTKPKLIEIQTEPQQKRE